jgi:predicted metalloprotease with PDZ domain
MSTAAWSRLLPAVIVLAALARPAAGRAADPPPVEVEVDLSDVARRMVHTRLTVPANPGPLTLYYPRWVPGTHGPIGPVGEQAGLRVSAGSDRLPWKRDDADPYAFHVTVPDGASAVEVTFDLLLQPPGTGSWLGIALTAATPKLAVLNWNELLVYPKGDGTMARPFRAAVRLPAEWKFGTALTAERPEAGRVAFAAVPLEELIDSPVLCGEYVKEVPIGPSGGPPHRVVLACDSEAGLDIPPELKANWDRLVVEAGKLFGARHYKAYTFLVTLSDQVQSFGLEHHECSDNRLSELALVTASLRTAAGTLLPHEYVHSWNGKFRRPADMIVPDYQRPQRTRLLWIYEGLTNYLGWVLAARSGLFTAEDARDSLGLQADRMAWSRGRSWRPLDDTAAANFIILPAPPGWTAYRRSLDYYDEGTLIWLEADVIIRQKTGGAKSLDDFCRAFHGGEGGRASVRGYTLDDLVAVLNGVVAHDWKGHFARRVSLPNEAPPLEGVTGAGWRLAYQDKPTPLFETAESTGKVLNLTPSIGLLVSDGKAADVVPDSPAAKAGLAPGVKLVAVNGRKYTADGLKAAVAATKTGGKLELLTESGGFYRTHAVEYRGGARYPKLERAEGRPDLLAEVLRPLAPPAGAK